MAFFESVDLLELLKTFVKQYWKRYTFIYDKYIYIRAYHCQIHCWRPKEKYFCLWKEFLNYWFDLVKENLIRLCVFNTYPFRKFLNLFVKSNMRVLDWRCGLRHPFWPILKYLILSKLDCYLYLCCQIFFLLLKFCRLIIQINHSIFISIMLNFIRILV